MEQARNMCAIAGILQLTIGFVNAPPCIISGIVTLAAAGLFAILAETQKK